MIRAVAYEVSVLVALSLFIGAIAIWSQILGG